MENATDGSVHRSELAKRKIEQMYRTMKRERADCALRRCKLEAKLVRLDVSKAEKRALRKEHFAKEMAFLRARRRPMSEHDFKMIQIIGRGAYGEVILVRHRESGEYYAMKKLTKKNMSRQEHVNHAWSERQVLVEAEHPFVCKLCFAFQNKEYLYLVMEFLPGGDLVTLLMKRDILTEEESRFYAAEMLVAIDTIHKLGFIHRDIKPDNVLIGADGHIKLVDFGLSTSFNMDMPTLPATNHQVFPNISADGNMDERGAQWNTSRTRKQAFSTVGTPNYMSVEIVKKLAYSKECDYWSLGVLLYEMLVGYPPFLAEDALGTCRKIINWQRTLKFPPEAELSWAAKSVIKSLICDAEHRLGSKSGLEDFKLHPFFKGVDWHNLGKAKPPFVPKLRGPNDLKYFEDECQPVPDNAVVQRTKPSYLKEPAVEEFIGFTFKRYNPRVTSRKSLASSMECLYINPVDEL